MPTKADKRKKELKAFARRRASRPEPIVVVSESLKVSGGVERRITRSHTDLLQNIEFVLVGAGRELPEFDDQCVEQVLRGALSHYEHEDPTIRSVIDSLDDIRTARGLSSDDLWSDALRVVYASLKRHSECLNGDRSYLKFAGQFIH
ncbi:hypothetical protein [Neorhodopirellula pilleata]|uniref:Uncharacterized protein n=1 Tax=Neorhodopirellula pilleata TaxID=2714738 RepID=A0A5C5ZYC4_9BACT|nr:hypothetical protein [Neorhodopirellula pilleata]TWT92299.1 hypothetical protein Pla100_48380 [Neorhodopirellula pilleata]